MQRILDRYSLVELSVTVKHNCVFMRNNQYVHVAVLKDRHQTTRKVAKRKIKL
jgi:hypothetical protein